MRACCVWFPIQLVGRASQYLDNSSIWLYPPTVVECCWSRMVRWGTKREWDRVSWPGRVKESMTSKYVNTNQRRRMSGCLCSWTLGKKGWAIFQMLKDLEEEMNEDDESTLKHCKNLYWWYDKMWFIFSQKLLLILSGNTMSYHCNITIAMTDRYQILFSIG